MKLNSAPTKKGLRNPSTLALKIAERRLNRQVESAFRGTTTSADAANIDPEVFGKQEKRRRIREFIKKRSGK